MTKEEWLQICRLNQEWYFRSVGLEEESIKKLMPTDSIFDDGRLEFFQNNFKPEINKETLDFLVENMSEGFWSDDLESFEENPQRDLIIWVAKRIYECGLKNGYLKAKE